MLPTTSNGIMAEFSRLCSTTVSVFSAALFFALTLLVWQSAAAQTPLADPLPARIEKGSLRVAAIPFVRAPRTSDPTDANAFARIQYLLPVPGGDRLAFNDTRGILYLTNTRGREPVVYLDLRHRDMAFTNACNARESGFMGFAFHPQFAAEGERGYGKFYTAFSAEPGSGHTACGDEGVVQDNVLVEWTANDAKADVFAGTWREVMRVGQSTVNHNIGTIAFNPHADSADFGLLYIGFGDGGGGNSGEVLTSQALATLLGTIVRIDPLGGDENSAYGIPADNPFASPCRRSGGGCRRKKGEIWAYGLRHPQQFSWDRDGRLFIADIGERQIEEINLGVAGGNYGWPLREGTFATAYGVGRVDSNKVFPLPDGDEAFVYPVAQYDHDGIDTGFAVGGGYVYRGVSVPALQGKYVFTDLPRGLVFAFDADNLPARRPAAIEEVRLYFDGEEKNLAEIAACDHNAGWLRVDARLGIDAVGELYLLTKGDGWIRKLVSLPRADSDMAESGNEPVNQPRQAGEAAP